MKIKNPQIPKIEKAIEMQDLDASNRKLREENVEAVNEKAEKMEISNLKKKNVLDSSDQIPETTEEKVKNINFLRKNVNQRK